MRKFSKAISELLILRMYGCDAFLLWNVENESYYVALMYNCFPADIKKNWQIMIEPNKI